LRSASRQIKGSAEAFAAPFAEDGHLVAFDGTHFTRRDEIISFQQPLFDTWLKGTRLVGEVKSVEFLSPDVALMHALGGTVMRGKSRPSPERDSIQTLVAVRRGGEWRLAAFQNTRVRPMGRNARNTFLWLFTDWLVEGAWCTAIDGPALSRARRLTAPSSDRAALGG
jgi:uncharacterized protein (TIGR02246 family)